MAYLGAKYPLQEVYEDYPSLPLDGIQAVIDWAGRGRSRVVPMRRQLRSLRVPLPYWNAVRCVPGEISAARAQSVCHRTAQGKEAQKHHHAEEAKLKGLVIVDEPVAHAVEDGRVRI
jgi:hypothetical protein